MNQPSQPLKPLKLLKLLKPSKPILIAIDGFAATGKSTLARQLAIQLTYTYLDTGAMYRAVAWYLLQNSIDWRNRDRLNSVLKMIDISFAKNDVTNKPVTILNNVDVELQIRSPDVSNVVSEIAAIKEVRKFLVKQQQNIGKNKNIVIDGRDIGTVVFPDAELKVFVIADMNVRLERRYKELQSNSIKITRDQVEKNLLKRDRDETTRIDSPLKKADDAFLLDTTKLTQQQQLTKVLKWVEKL